MNKKWVTIGVLGVLILGGGYWGYQHFKAKPAAATFITAPAKMADVTKVITATGTVNFPHSIPLAFKQAGQITEINVKTGDPVKAGQILAKTDDSSLQLAVQQQQASVSTAELKLQTLKESFNDQTMASAQSAVAKAQQGVATAQQNLTTAQQNADPTYLTNQVTQAQQNVKQASDDLAKAQQSGNDTASTTALNQALDALTAAQNAQNGGAAQALAAAQAQYRSAQADLVSAQAQLTQQEQGPKATDLASAQADIDSAQVQLDSAEKNLQNAEIIAPVDGVVVSAPLQLGQQSDANSIVTITPSSDTLQVDAAIDQADINQVKMGQKVDITLDSAPNQHISGTVSQIAIQGTITSNVTTYDVTVTVDKPTDLLKAGMNANVSIIVAQAKNVLTVPSAAVKTRGTQSFVMVPVTESGNSSNQAANQSNKSNNGNQGTQGGQSYQRNQGTQGTQGSNRTGNGSASSGGRAASNERFVPVTVGLDDGTNVEIKSGLQEGQEVITGTRSTSATTGSNSGSGLRLGGGGANPARAMSGGGGGGFRGN